MTGIAIPVNVGFFVVIALEVVMAVVISQIDIIIKKKYKWVSISGGKKV